MDTNGLLNCFRWFKDATALMQSGKAYENLSDGLKLLIWHGLHHLPSDPFILLLIYLLYYYYCINNSSSLSVG
jgi:hypothetical protein